MQIYKNTATRPENSIVDWLTENSALILIIFAVLSFLLTAIIQVIYYQGLFDEKMRTEVVTVLSICLAGFFQGIRCATLSSTAKLFSIAQRARGFFILAISFSVTVYCSYEACEVAALWEIGRPEIGGHIRLVLLCLVWAGWALELVLIINLSGAAAAAAAAAPAARPQPHYSGNGQHSGNFTNA